MRICEKFTETEYFWKENKKVLTASTSTLDINAKPGVPGLSDKPGVSVSLINGGSVQLLPLAQPTQLLAHVTINVTHYQTWRMPNIDAQPIFHEGSVVDPNSMVSLAPYPDSQSGYVRIQEGKNDPQK